MKKYYLKLFLGFLFAVLTVGIIIGLSISFILLAIDRYL